MILDGLPPLRLLQPLARYGGFCYTHVNMQSSRIPAMPTTTIRLSDEEHAIFESYCKQHQRTKNDVIREHIRSLQQQPQLNASLDLGSLMLAQGAREAQLVPVVPGIYELYLDGKYVCGGTYEEIAMQVS